MRLENTAGDRNRNRKVSSEDVREIRRAVQAGTHPQTLAKRYNVHTETIRKIVRRENWRSVD
jgi:Mor family transcriptional regulator